MENRNISIAKVNGYTFEKVMKAKKYLEEIGSNKRTFPFDKLVGYYNDLLGTHEAATGCRCQSPKYFNGIQNYFKYGKLTLINNGVATEADFEEKKEETPAPIENAEKRINLGTEEIVSESVSEDKVEGDKVEEDKASDEAENEPTEKKKVGRPRKKDDK